MLVNSLGLKRIRRDRDEDQHSKTYRIYRHPCQCRHNSRRFTAPNSTNASPFNIRETPRSRIQAKKAGFSKVQIATGTKLHHHHLSGSFMDGACTNTSRLGMAKGPRMSSLKRQLHTANPNNSEVRSPHPKGDSWPTKFPTHCGLCAESSPSSQNLGRCHESKPPPCF